jgi:hypothetical protein
LNETVCRQFQDGSHTFISPAEVTEIIETDALAGPKDKLKTLAECAFHCLATANPAAPAHHTTTMPSDVAAAIVVPSGDIAIAVNTAPSSAQASSTGSRDS